MSTSDLRAQLAELAAIEQELEQRRAVENPIAHGLPNLLRPIEATETDEEFIERQNNELIAFIRTKLFIYKDGRKIRIKVIPEMSEFLTDVFYRRQSQAILWKPRGSGGSLSTSVIIWLMMVYHKMSFINIAGSGQQSKVIFEYVKQLWDCFPSYKKLMFTDDPTTTEIRLRDNIKLICTTASEKQVRGKHAAGLVVDEASQKDQGTDDVIKAAMQGPMSEKDHVIILLSTFHNPVGLFQEVWDHATEKGYARYKWDAIATMAKCVEPFDCLNNCPLTDRIEMVDKHGILTGIKYEGCKGRARTTEGWVSFQELLNAKMLNAGTDIFKIEFLCERPEFASTVYPTSMIERSVRECPVDPNGYPFLEWSKMEKKTIGVDWGLGQTAMVIAARGEHYIKVLETRVLQGQLSGAVTTIIDEWTTKYGPTGIEHSIPIYADASHPYNNAEIQQKGYELYPVPFAKWKEFGIENVARYFVHDRIRIHPDNVVLIRQLKTYRRGKDGKPVKHEDHGPDALLCSLMGFIFMEEFGREEGIMRDDVRPSSILRF